MFRKAAMVVSMLLLVFVTACGSKSASDTSASGGGATPSATASAGPCPTKETKKFAKTLFVTDAALAGGAFKHWIYTPMKQGKFKKGTHGRITAIIKAVAAGAFVVNRLNAVKKNAEGDPFLCKLTIGPITKFQGAISNIVHKGKTGNIDESSVTDAGNLLEQFRSNATKGGAGFKDNENANIGG